MNMRTLKTRTLKTLTGAALIAATCLLGTAPALATETDEPQPSDPLDQEVRDDEATGVEQVVVDRGHVDIGPRFLDGEWSAQLRDDSVVPPVWRNPEDIVLRVNDDALLPVPESEDYAFLGVEPGTEMHVVPQNEIQGVVWLGWNSQDPEVVQRAPNGLELEYLGMEGPGDVTLFLQSGNFDPPQLLWSSQEGTEAPQSVWVETNTHVHANWAFSEPGVYFVNVAVNADLEDGSSVSDDFVLRFAVGDAASDDEALAGPEGGEVEQTTQGSDETETDGVEQETASGGSSLTTILFVVIGVLVVVLVIVAALALRGRRARALALQAEKKPETSGDKND